MDIQLPVLDGIEATKEIRKMERSANIGILPNTPPASELQTPPTAGPSTGSMTLQPPPASPFRASVIIVALTASVFNSDRVAALAAGCNDFLNKPVSLHWLEKKIIEWGSMQYILLSGFPSDNWNRWRQQTAGAGANAGGTNNSPRSQAALASQNELRRGFGSGPDANARALASRLHMPARRASPIRPAAPVRGSGSTGGPLVTATSRPSEAAAAASSSSGGGPTAPAPVFAPAFSAVPPSPSQIARTRAGSATAPPAPAPTSSAPTAPNAPTASTAPVISLTSSTPPEPRSERDPLDASSANPSADASADADLNSNSNSKTLPNTDLDLVQQQGEPSTSVAGGDGAAAPAAPAAPTEPTAPDAAQGS